MRRSKYLFDDLVGAGQKPLRHLQAERLSRFQIDDEFEICRSLHWKFSGFFTSQNAIHIRRCASVQLDYVCSIGDQPAADDEIAIGIIRWNAALSGERGN